MAEYKYSQTLNDAYTVRYNITPDLGEYVAVGEPVVIDGTAYDRYRKIESVGVRIQNIHLAGSDLFFETPVSIAAGKTGAFRLAFTMEYSASFWRDSGRALEGCPFNFVFSSGDYTDEAEDQKLNFLRYRLAPKILAMDFERCQAGGTWADDGEYLRCKALKISKGGQANADDFTVARITCSGSDGSIRDVNLTREQIAAALTPSGYSESKPALFSGFRSALGVTYTVTLALGDAYEQAAYADTVMRSFANMHLSGARTGGVAFGRFSSSTEGNPKLESDYPAYLYGGIAAINASRQASSQRALGIQVGSILPQGNVSGGSYKDFPVEFPAPYPEENAPIVLASFATTSTAGNFGRCCCGVLDVTSAGFTLRFFNGDSSARNPGFQWIALNTSAAALLQRPYGSMSSNSSQSCMASASSAYSSNYPAWRAFDNNLESAWASQSSDASPWIQLEMDVALKNIVVRIYARKSAPVNHPTAGTILGSSDGSAWTAIGGFSGWKEAPSNGLLGEVACSNAAPYRYVRVRVTGRADEDSYVAIGNIKIIGEG